MQMVCPRRNIRSGAVGKFTRSRPQITIVTRRRLGYEFSRSMNVGRPEDDAAKWTLTLRAFTRIGVPNEPRTLCHDCEPAHHPVSVDARAGDAGDAFEAIAVGTASTAETTKLASKTDRSERSRVIDTANPFVQEGSDSSPTLAHEPLALSRAEASERRDLPQPAPAPGGARCFARPGSAARRAPLALPGGVHESDRHRRRPLRRQIWLSRSRG